MSRMKITVSIEADLVRRLDEIGATSHQSRSRLVEASVRDWSRAALERDLIAGYRAMSGEDREMAEAGLAAGAETLK